MYKLILLAATILILVTVGSSNSSLGYLDPKHCHGYNVCFSIGYDDGYSDAQKGQSPAYACVVTARVGVQDITKDFAPAMADLIFSTVLTVNKVRAYMFMVIIIKLVLTKRLIVK